MDFYYETETQQQLSNRIWFLQPAINQITSHIKFPGDVHDSLPAINDLFEDLLFFSELSAFDASDQLQFLKKYTNDQMH